MDEGGYVDDLELLEEYDLPHDDSDDSRSDGERRADEDDAPKMTKEELEQIYQEVKATVVEVVSALGGLEERQSEVDDSIVVGYIIGDDCLREFKGHTRCSA